MLNSVQLLRALAAWLVVFHHYVEIFYGFNNSDWISYFLSNYGALGVDLFFVISGFVIYLSADNKNIRPEQFAIHRIARIVPAYWLFTALSAITILYAPGLIAGAKYDTLFMVRSLLFIPTVNPSNLGIYPILAVGWTLNFEMLFYTIFFLALYLPKKLRIPAIIIGVVSAQQLLPRFGGSAIFYAQPIMFEFIFGIVIAIIYKRGWLSRISPALAVVLALLALAIIASQPLSAHAPFLIGAPCAVLMITLLSQERFFGNNFIIRRLADWSYSTYLCHPIIIFAMLTAHRKFTVNTTLTLLLTCTFIAFFSWFCFNFIERPILTTVKRRESRRRENKLAKNDRHGARISGADL